MEVAVLVEAIVVGLGTACVLALVLAGSARQSGVDMWLLIKAGIDIASFAGPNVDSVAQ